MQVQMGYVPALYCTVLYCTALCYTVLWLFRSSVLGRIVVAEAAVSVPILYPTVSYDGVRMCCVRLSIHDAEEGSVALWDNRACLHCEDDRPPPCHHGPCPPPPRLSLASLYLADLKHSQVR
jgi:hypothetical protein